MQCKNAIAIVHMVAGVCGMHKSYLIVLLFGIQRLDTC